MGNGFGVVLLKPGAGRAQGGRSTSSVSRVSMVCEIFSPVFSPVSRTMFKSFELNDSLIACLGALRMLLIGGC